MYLFYIFATVFDVHIFFKANFPSGQLHCISALKDTGRNGGYELQTSNKISKYPGPVEKVNPIRMAGNVLIKCGGKVNTLW